MSGQSFPRVPVNPRLKFGVPLEKVCEKGSLHPGLRELFLKAYLSAGGDDYVDQDQAWGIPRVLEALKAGQKGQGSVAERISLKSKLESGKWIVATQTPPGAPLWLLRHFLGCLPQPLLHGSQWKMIAIVCGAALRPSGKNYEGEIFKKLLEALGALPPENYLTLAALVLLIRNLSMMTSANASETLHQKAVNALSRYFTAAVTLRPYRPGLHTALDKLHKPLLVFLSKNWPEVKELCRRDEIFHRRNNFKLGYEFANSEFEIFCRSARVAMDAEDIEDQIDNPENSIRISKKQPLDIGTSVGHFSVDVSRNKKTETSPTDAVVAPNVNEPNIRCDNLPVLIHIPKEVYLIGDNKINNDASMIDGKNNSGKSKEDLIDVIKLPAGTELDYKYVQLNPKRDSFESSNSDERLINGNNDNPVFDVKKLIRKYEREKIFNGTCQIFDTMGRIEVKIDGTQTFECEFSENNTPSEPKKSEEGNNNFQVSPLRVEILENWDELKREQRENILSAVNGPSNLSKFSKIYGKRLAAIPLTKSTALLIKKFSNDKEFVYFVNGKSIDELEETISSTKEGLASKFNRDVETLTNPFKEVNKFKEESKNSNNDFVSELKNNFKQGRRRPSDAKSASKTFLIDSVATVGQGSSKVFRLVEFLREKTTKFRSLTKSNSSEELFQQRFRVPVSSANSI